MIKLKKNENIKKGITLVVLIITIVVALVILSITIVGVKTAVDNANLVTYAKDLASIQDATAQYYINNSAFPTAVENESALSQEDILGITAEPTLLTADLQTNGDYNDNSQMGSFYKIDLAKLNVTKSMRGIQKNSDQSDTYYVSYPSMNIYYIKGIKIKGVRYFSLNQKLTNITKITKEDYQADVQQVAGITVKRASKTWTNKLGITVSVDIGAGETLFTKISNGDQRQINVITGINTFSFDSIAELKQKAPQITDAEVNDIDNSSMQDAKFIEILKKKDDVEIGTIKLDLSNYERVAPVKETEPEITSELDTNIVKFKAIDSISKIKEVRYEYLKVFNENGLVENYYSGVEELNEDYMKSRAKKGSITKEGQIELKIPKDVEGIQILIIDKAGNWTNIIQPMYSGNMLYVGIIPKEISLTKATFKLVSNSKFGINNIVTYISSDGTNYVSPKTYTLNKSDVITFQNVDDYIGLEGFSEKKYIKVLATDNNAAVDSRVQEQRVFELTKDDSKNLGTREKNASKWNKPYIPVGFEYIEGSVEDGFVIQDTSNNAQTNGNEFVWVPVKDINDFKRYQFLYNSGTTSQIDFIDLTTSTFYLENETTSEYTSMKNSVGKYGGFYIARYEAGISKKMPQEKPTADTTTTYANGEYRPVSKKDVPVWNYIGWGGISTDIATDGGPGNDLANGVVKVARTMYPNTQKKSEYALSEGSTNYTDVISTLCYDVQWDATMNFLQEIKNPNAQNKPYIVDSMYMGNFEDVDGTNTPALTGDSKYSPYMYKNIYDLAGNVLEKTMGYIGQTVRIYRGGNYTGDQDVEFNNASSRDNNYPEYTNANCGFRVTLYIN